MKHIQKILVLAAFALALPATAHADTWWDCEPIEVLDLSNRVHVQCSNSVNEGGSVVRFLAVPTSDTNRAARFISLATAALLSGKKVRAYVPTSSATNAPGCSSSDCRTPGIVGVAN